jgi:CheY-like chemotaxis protein
MIAITAYAAESDRDEFLSRGFTHYISKPLALSELLRLINGIFLET